MQNISSFNQNLATAILLCGGAGVGKTTLSMRMFPKTYVFVADLNFASGLRYLEKIKETSNVVGYDVGSVEEDGKIVPVSQRYDRMLKKLNEAIASKDVDAIVLDSATFIEDIIKAKICGATREDQIKLEGFGQWGSLVMTWKSLIMQMRQSGKKVIMTAHEQKEQDESDKIYKYQIAVDGSIRSKLPAIFSDVWRCEIEEKANVHTWNIRPLGNVRHEHLKNTYGFTGVLTQDEAVKKVRAQ